MKKMTEAKPALPPGVGVDKPALLFVSWCHDKGHGRSSRSWLEVASTVLVC